MRDVSSSLSSNSGLIARRKWSDGFRRAGQGNPADAKYCNIHGNRNSIFKKLTHLFYKVKREWSRLYQLELLLYIYMVVVQWTYGGSLGCRSEVDGPPFWQQEERVEAVEYLTAGLVDGRYNCPTISGQVSELGCHKICCSTTKPQKWTPINKAGTPTTVTLVHRIVQYKVH